MTPHSRPDVNDRAKRMDWNHLGGLPLPPNAKDLYRHNLNNLRQNHPVLFEAMESGRFRRLYRAELSGNPEAPSCRVSPFGQSAPPRGEEGIIHGKAPWDEARRAVLDSGWMNHDLTIVCNTGLGYTARFLGEQFFLAGFQDSRERKLVLIEEDAGLFQLSLCLHNWDVNLGSAQIRWIVGVPAGRALRHALFSECPWLCLESIRCVPGGLQHERERHQQSRLEEAIGEQRGGVLQRYRERVRSIAARKIAPFPGAPKPILFLDAHEHLPFQKAVMGVLRSWGWPCKAAALRNHPDLGIHAHGFHKNWAWLDLLDGFPASAVFAVNQIPAVFGPEKGIAERQIPKIAWFLDDPRRILGIPRADAFDTDTFYLFCYDRGHLAYLRDMGYKRVHYMPCGTPFGPVEPTAPPSDVVYVGSLMKGVGLVANRLLLPYFPKMLEWLRECADAAGAGGPGCETGCLQQIPPPGPALHPSVLISFLQDELTNRRRLAVLEAAAPFGLRTYGKNDLASDICSPRLAACYQGRGVSYLDELPDVYAQSAINLNINHAQTKSGVPPRVFDALAAGGFVLSDSNPEIASMFDIGDEIACFDSPEELRELIPRYLADATAREAMARKGQRKVLERHTLGQRLRKIFQTVFPGG